MTKKEMLSEIKDFLDANGIDHDSSPSYVHNLLKQTTLGLDAVELMLELTNGSN